MDRRRRPAAAKAALEGGRCLAELWTEVCLAEEVEVLWAGFLETAWDFCRVVEELFGCAVVSARSEAVDRQTKAVRSALAANDFFIQ